MSFYCGVIYLFRDTVSLQRLGSGLFSSMPYHTSKATPGPWAAVAESWWNANNLSPYFLSPLLFIPLSLCLRSHSSLQPLTDLFFPAAPDRPVFLLEVNVCKPKNAPCTCCLCCPTLALLTSPSPHATNTDPCCQPLP